MNCTSCRVSVSLFLNRTVDYLAWVFDVRLYTFPLVTKRSTEADLFVTQGDKIRTHELHRADGLQ